MSKFQSWPVSSMKEQRLLFLVASLLFPSCGTPGTKYHSPARPASRITGLKSDSANPALGSICLISVSPDGRRFVVGTREDPELYFFNTRPLALDGVRRMDSFSHYAAFSRIGQWTAVDEDGGTGPSRCFLIEPVNHQLFAILHGAEDEAQLKFTPDGRYLLGLSYGDLLEWRVPGGLRILKKTLLGVEHYWETSLVFVPGTRGRIIAAQDSPRRWRFFDSAAGKPLLHGRTVRWPEGDEGDWFLEEGRPAVLLRVPRKDAVPPETAGLLVVDPFTGRIRRSLGPRTAIVRACRDLSDGRISPEGKRLGLRVDAKRRLALFSLRTGERIRLLEAPRGVVEQGWNFVGPHGIVAPMGNSCVFWDVASGKIRLTLVPDLLLPNRSERSDPEWIAYTPEGSFTGSDDCLMHFTRSGIVFRRVPAAVNREIWQLLKP